MRPVRGNESVVISAEYAGPTGPREPRFSAMRAFEAFVGRWTTQSAVYDTQYQVNRLIKLVLLGSLAALTFSACGASAGSNSGTRQVIAGENFWGSIAAQLGGNRVSVTSIVQNPATDPHEYESSASDARAFATADYVILNGAGYDDWGQKLLSANPNQARKVLTIADLLNKKPGDNPHLWYNPDWVE